MTVIFINEHGDYHYINPHTIYDFSVAEYNHDYSNKKYVKLSCYGADYRMVYYRRFKTIEDGLKLLNDYATELAAGKMAIYDINSRCIELGIEFEK